MKKHYLGEIKVAVTMAGAALTAWLGVLAVPVYMLVVLNLTDYLTGIIAAPYRGDRRSSAKGLRGIAKKVCMWILVGVGAAIDWLLAYTATTAGLVLVLGSPVGAAVAVWLICNEIVSILENIGDIGVRLPAFLRQLVEWVSRETAEQMVPMGKEISYGTETDTSDK